MFELQSSFDLFKEIQQAMVEYHKEPTNRLLLFLLFSLNHLREWIAGMSSREMHKKRMSGVHLNPNEEFFFSLSEIKEFQTIKNLCNRSKHYVIEDSKITSVTVGANCESSCNDSLDQVYFRIEGVDSRKVFALIMLEYHRWFEAY